LYAGVVVYRELLSDLQILVTIRSLYVLPSGQISLLVEISRLLYARKVELNGRVGGRDVRESTAKRNYLSVQALAWAITVRHHSLSTLATSRYQHSLKSSRDNVDLLSEESGYSTYIGTYC
jgi:hypothetical protein